MPPHEDLPAESIPVSVIIVSRNRIEALRRTLAALLRPGTPHPPEVVVVDAGSRDGSADVDSEFPEVRLVKMPRDFGRSRARNIGARTATRDLILFLEAGVELSAEVVIHMAQALEADPRAAAVAPKLLDQNGQPVEQAYPLPSAPELAAICLTATPLAKISGVERAEAVRDDVLLLRKSFLAGMNFFDERRFGDSFAELDLFRQMKNAGRDILILSGAAARLPVPAPESPHPAERALRASDRITGAAAYIAKRNGSFAAISFQIKMFLGALAALLRPADASVARRILPGIFSGVKIDGSQD
ncbi:MAG: glycosyltransferase [Bryobacteraceae bacterium]|nr:glycosyltransferase [Bryobacteraceae bacterium]